MHPCNRMDGVYIGFAVISLGLFIWFFVSYQSNIGGTDKWDTLKNNVLTLWVVPCIAVICLFIASLYSTTETPEHRLYYMMFISCLVVGLSVGAVQIALISR